MYLNLSFHFHAYQPGDFILRKRGSPSEPPEFLERKSPVSLKMGDAEIRGDNWTDAMLRFYGGIWKLFGKMSSDASVPFCSVDMEPVTLQLLAQRQPNSFWAYRELIKSRTIEPLATVPFHVLLPHVEVAEQRFLSRLSFLLHSAVSGVLESPAGAVGFWFPENLYCEKAGRAVAQAFAESPLHTGNDVRPRMLFFVLDRGQMDGMDIPQAAMSANFVVFDTERVGVFGRDRALSDDWAFRNGTIRDLVRNILAGRLDSVKETKGVQYTLTLASDLESLAAGADQADRFRDLRKTLSGMGVNMISHAEFLSGKLRRQFRSWEGELEAKPFLVKLREFSSWSDYLDQGVGYPSDTRWTGLRRWDGLVIHRWSRRNRISQIWKQGFARVQERVAGLVRRGVYDAIENCHGPGKIPTTGQTEQFLLGYSNLVFAPVLLASGTAHGPLEYRKIIDSRLPDCRLPDEAALAARSYFEMLMSLRSCPLFWENIDTRVTFQGVVMMTQSLLDLTEVCRRLELRARARDAEQVCATNLFEFERVHGLYNLDSLFGYQGWEVREDAWQMAIQSEVPDRSGYDVVRRASLFAAVHDGSEAASRLLSGVRFEPSQVVADTGNIEGESHGKWDCVDCCEHKA